jgi:hypothetical protein
MDAHPPVADDLHRRLGELLHAHEPLQRDERLDALARALRVRHVVRVGSVATTLSPSASTTGGRASIALRPGELAGLGGHPPVLADDADRLQAVRWPISKSFGSWPGVIFRAPVPKSVLTYSSAMTGSSRPAAAASPSCRSRWR